jgi:hypothetical protein
MKATMNKSEKGVKTFTKESKKVTFQADKEKGVEDLDITGKTKRKVVGNQFKTGKITKNLRVGEERLRLKSIRDLTKDEFFFTSVENKVYCFYNCFFGERTLQVEQLTRTDIVDRVYVKTQCLLHCISRQTLKSFDELTSLGEYKDVHTVKDAIEISKQLQLNMIIQDSPTLATMVRYGAMNDPYILIAHNTAVKDFGEYELGHWCIQNTVTLNELPHGMWQNADYSMYEMPAFMNNSVFYMDDNEYNQHTIKIRDLVGSLLTTGVLFPPEVSATISDGVFITNGAVNSPLQGIFNFPLPYELAELVNSCINVEHNR